MDNFPGVADHFVAILFCVALPLYAARRRSHDLSHIHFDSETKKQIYLSGSLTLFGMAFIIFAEWLFHKRLLSELGLRSPENFGSWWWMVLVFIFVYTFDAILSLATKKGVKKTVKNWRNRTPFLPTKINELPSYFFLCACAGIFEEVIYRGFLVTYCWYLFEGFPSREILAITIPAIVFSLAHYYQGKLAILKIFILSIFFGYLFIYSNSLLIVMLLHFLVDAVGGILSLKFMKDEEPQIDSPDDNNYLPLSED